MAAGSFSSLVLRGDGTAWSAGYNAYGQLGDGSTLNRKVFAQVAGLSGVTAVSSNAEHALALRNDGTLWVWAGTPMASSGMGRAPTASPGCRWPG